MARARVALPAAAAAQLVVNPPRLVALGAEYQQSSGRFDLLFFVKVNRVAAELNVHAAAGHVGRYRDRAEASGLGQDLGFALVLLGVQDVHPDARLLQPLGQNFVFFN